MKHIMTFMLVVCLFTAVANAEDAAKEQFNKDEMAKYDTAVKAGDAKAIVALAQSGSAAARIKALQYIAQRKLMVSYDYIVPLLTETNMFFSDEENAECNKLAGVVLAKCCGLKGKNKLFEVWKDPNPAAAKAIPGVAALGKAVFNDITKALEADKTLEKITIATLNSNVREFETPAIGYVCTANNPLFARQTLMLAVKSMKPTNVTKLIALLETETNDDIVRGLWATISDCKTAATALKAAYAKASGRYKDTLSVMLCRVGDPSVIKDAVNGSLSLDDGLRRTSSRWYGVIHTYDKCVISGGKTAAKELAQAIRTGKAIDMYDEHKDTYGKLVPIDRNMAEKFMGQLGSDGVDEAIRLLSDRNKLVSESASRVLAKITGENFGTSYSKWYQWWSKNKAQFIENERIAKEKAEADANAKAKK